MSLCVLEDVGVCSGSCDSEDAEEGGVEMEEVSVTTALLEGKKEVQRELEYR